MNPSTKAASTTPDLLKTVLLPALLAGAGTGAVSAYMSAKQRDPNEDGAARRKRIMRNALLGAGMGGAAGAAIPTGLSALTRPFVKDPESMNLGRRATSGLAHNLLPIGTAVGGAGALMHQRGKEQESALSFIADQLKGKTVGEGAGAMKVDNVGRLRGAMAQSTAANPSAGIQSVFRAMHKHMLPGTGDDTSRRILARELLGEAGYQSDDMFKALRKPGGATNENIASYIRSKFRGPEFLRGISPNEFAAQSVGTWAEPLAESYIRHVRPGAMETLGRSGLGRLGTLGKLGLLGGGVFAAKQLQNALEGR